MKEKLVGIVCSANAKLAYCIAGSHHYKEMRREGRYRNTTIIYVNPRDFNPLNFRNIKNVLKYEVKRRKQKGF